MELEGFSKLEILRFSILLYSNDKGKLYWFKIVVQEFLFWSQIDLQRLDLLSYLKEKKKKRQNIFKNSLKVLSIRQWKAEIPENRKTNKAIPIVAQLSVWRKILDCNTRKGTAC